MTVFERNNGPELSISDEPWIPVVRAGSSDPELVSLRHFLLDAGQLSSLAEANPITRAALWRFLISMAYLVIDFQSQQQGVDDKRGRRKLVKAASESTTGFDPGSVEAVLDRWGESLFVFHPDKPFFQDPGLATDSSQKKPLGPLAITPFLPGDSSSRWGVNVEDAKVVNRPELVRRLITCWFYTPAGNSSRRRDPKSGTESKRVLSAAAANFPSLTNIFRVGGTVAESLCGNMVDEYFPMGRADGVPAFLDIGNLTIRTEEPHPLYSCTLSASTALVVGSSPGDEHFGTNFLRGSTIFDGRYDDPAARLGNLGLADDPHVIYLDNPKHKANHPRLNLSGSFASLPSFTLKLNELALNEASATRWGVARASRTVLGDKLGPPDLELVQIEQGGTGSGRTIVGAQLMRTSASRLGPALSSDDPVLARTRSTEVIDVLDPLLGDRQSARTYFRYALRRTIDEKGSGGIQELLRTASQDLLSQVGLSVAEVVQQISDNGVDSIDLLDQKRRWRRIVMELFEDYAGPFRLSQTGASRYWNAHGYLSAKLNEV